MEVNFSGGRQKGPGGLTPAPAVQADKDVLGPGLSARDGAGLWGPVPGPCLAEGALWGTVPAGLERTCSPGLLRDPLGQSGGDTPGHKPGPWTLPA